MRGREFIWVFGTAAVWGSIGDTDEEVLATDAAGVNTPPTSQTVDACTADIVPLHDTYAQALYLDASKGPRTGIITVASASATLTVDFWHGHDSVPHRFTLEPMHFAALRRGERVTLGTTPVDGHAHTLFIDPKDEACHVAGALDVDLQVGCA